MNPQVQETATQTLLNLGLPGVCILALGAAVVYLVRQNVQLRAQIDSEHEKRIQDAKANTQVLLEAHDQLHEGLEILNKQLEHLKS